MNIAAAMMSILFDVSEAISAENCIGSTCTAKPASLPISVMRSTITPWIVLVLVSRKVKGTPVGVEPTFITVSANAGGTAPRLATAPKSTCLRRMPDPSRFCDGILARRVGRGKGRGRAAARQALSNPAVT